MPTEWLSPQEAADRLGVHVDTVKRYVREGKLGATKLPGGWWKFSEADVEKFLAAHRVEPEEASA